MDQKPSAPKCQWEQDFETGSYTFRRLHTWRGHNMRHTYEKTEAERKLEILREQIIANFVLAQRETR